MVWDEDFKKDMELEFLSKLICTLETPEERLEAVNYFTGEEK